MKAYLFILLQICVGYVSAQTAGGTGTASITNGIPNLPPFPPLYPIPKNSTATPEGTGPGVTPITSQPKTAVFSGTAAGTSSSALVAVPLSSSSASVTTSSVNGPSDNTSAPTESTDGFLISSSSIVLFSSSSGTVSSSPSLLSIIATGPGTTPTSTAITSSSTGSITAAPSSTNIVLPSGIILTPATAVLGTTGTEIKTSASDLSSLIVGIFPLIQQWIDDPGHQPPKVTAVTNELNNILPKASEFLDRLPKPTDPVEPCQKGSRRRSLHKRSFLDGLFKSVFNLVTCVIDDANKLKDGITEGVEDTVKTLTDDLRPIIDALNEADPADDSDPSTSVSSQQSSSQQSSSSSSSSCSLKTVSNCQIACTATAITTVGGAKKRAEGEACRTVCGAPITACSATAVTSVSTSTVTSTSSGFRLCSPNCSECANDSAPPQPTGIDLSGYMTASNGILFLPPQTSLPADETLAVRSSPKETSTSAQGLSKRALSSPSNFPGGVSRWIIFQVNRAKRLGHGQNSNNPSTAFTYTLTNVPDIWAVVNLYGCTSVIVVSRKRIWMSHFWEDPSFLEPNNLRLEILDPLRNGGAGIQQGIAAFTGPGGDFESIPENKVRAFIVTPYRRLAVNPASNDLEYSYEVGKIQDVLEDLLGREDAIVFPYKARGPDPGVPGIPRSFSLPHGKVVVQYDPLQARMQAPGGCQLQMAQLEIWLEDNPQYRYQDHWQALPIQRVLLPLLPSPTPVANGKMKRVLPTPPLTDVDEDDWEEFRELLKRQDGGSCPLANSALSAYSSVSTPETASSQAVEPTTLQTGDPTTLQTKDPTTLQTITVSNSISTTPSPPSPATEPPPALDPAPSPSSLPAYTCKVPLDERSATRCLCYPTNCDVKLCEGVELKKGENGCDDQCNGCQV